MPITRRLLEPAELHEFQPCTISTGREPMTTSGVDERSARRRRAAGSRSISEMEAEMGAALHAHRRAQEHDPDEAGARDLVVPGEGAAHHVAREDAEQQVHASTPSSRGGATPRRCRARCGSPDAIRRPSRPPATLSIHSLPTLAPTSRRPASCSAWNGLDVLHLVDLHARLLMRRGPASLVDLGLAVERAGGLAQRLVHRLLQIRRAAPCTSCRLVNHAIGG